MTNKEIIPIEILRRGFNTIEDRGFFIIAVMNMYRMDLERIIKKNCNLNHIEYTLTKKHPNSVEYMYLFQMYGTQVEIQPIINCILNQNLYSTRETSEDTEDTEDYSNIIPIADGIH